MDANAAPVRKPCTPFAADATATDTNTDAATPWYAAHAGICQDALLHAFFVLDNDFCKNPLVAANPHVPSFTHLCLSSDTREEFQKTHKQVLSAWGAPNRLDALRYDTFNPLGIPPQWAFAPGERHRQRSILWEHMQPATKGLATIVHAGSIARRVTGQHPKRRLPWFVR